VDRYGRSRCLHRLFELNPGVRNVVEAALRILLEAAAQQPAHGRRRRRRQRAPVGFALDDGRERIGGRGAGERAAAREHLVEHASERPDVGPLVDRLSARLLGAHVGGSPDDASGFSRVETERRGVEASFVDPGVRIDRLRDAEVEHLHDTGRCDQDVGRLQVAVDDAAFVRRLERARDLLRGGQGVAERQRSATDAAGEPLAFDEFEHERLNAGGVLDPVDGADVGMIERREQPRLACESGDSFRIADKQLWQYLDRDIARELRVARLVDLTHPSGAERRQDFVRTETRARGKSHRLSGPDAPRSGDTHCH